LLEALEGPGGAGRDAQSLRTGQAGALRKRIEEQLGRDRCELRARLDSLPAWRKWLLAQLESEVEPDVGFVKVRRASGSQDVGDLELLAERSVAGAVRHTTYSPAELVFVAQRARFHPLDEGLIWLEFDLLLVTWLPCVLVLYAFFSGGLTYRLCGLCLVRATGRRAWGIQCAARAALFWLPLWAAWATAAWADSRAYETHAVVWGAATSVFIVLVIYAPLALRSPTRAPHDFLVGTYLVPH
jgi:hypothetical protein